LKFENVFMKLRPEIKNNITPQLILRINELYHDFENRAYNQRYASLFEMERKRWEALAETYIYCKKPLVCLDYGTGTGFVAKIIAPKLKPTDSLICTDISSEMLSVTETDLRNLTINSGLKFIKTNGTVINLPNESVDIITVNAVLHHLPNLSLFATEASRVLKPGGKLIIVHEPNADTKLPALYQLLLSTLKHGTNIHWLIMKMTEKSVLLETLLRKILSKTNPIYKHRNEFLNKISDILIQEKLIDRKLRGVEIQQLVDIQTEAGFSKEKIFTTFEPTFNVVEWKTFNYIALKFKNLENKLNSYYQKKFPDNGATFLVVFTRK